MTDRAREPLLVVLTDRVGLRNAYKVLHFVALWAIVYECRGDPVPSIGHFADFWQFDERNAYRAQKLFREALPGNASPNVLWAQLREVNPNKDELVARMSEIADDDRAAAKHRHVKKEEIEALAAWLGTTTPVL